MVQKSNFLQNKLKASIAYSEFDKNSDVVTLLMQIKHLGNKMEENTSVCDSLHESKVKLHTYK